MKWFERLAVALRRPSPARAPSSALLDGVDAAQLAAPSSLVRLGTPYGGWLLPAAAPLDADSLCYLAGAGEDISFDCALVERYGCRARIIDPTPRAIAHFAALTEAVRTGTRMAVNGRPDEFYDIGPEAFSRLSFHAVGLSDQDTELKFFMPRNPAHVSCSTVNLQRTDTYFTAQCHRVQTLMAQLGDRRLDLLKMDIEGAEYAVIRDIVSSGILPKVLLIEFDELHSPQDAGASERIRRHVRLLLDAGMRCVAVEGCNATFVA